MARDWGKCYALAACFDVCLHEYTVKGGLYGHTGKNECRCVRVFTLCSACSVPAETGVHDGVRSRLLHSRAVLIFPQLYRALQTVESVKRMRVGSSFVLALSRNRVPTRLGSRAVVLSVRRANFFRRSIGCCFWRGASREISKDFWGKIHALDFSR